MARVLVLDEDPVSLYALEGLTKEHDVMTAKNGLEALMLYQNHEYDVLIAELHTPVMAGMEVVQRISELHGPCKVIFITLKPEECVINTNCDHICLTKPIRLDVVMVAIETILAPRQPTLKPSASVAETFRNLRRDIQEHLNAVRKKHRLALDTSMI